MGLLAHLALGSIYSVTFIVGYRRLKAGEVESAAKYGIVTAATVASDLALYWLGIGLFS